MPSPIIHESDSTQYSIAPFVKSRNDKILLPAGMPPNLLQKLQLRKCWYCESRLLKATEFCYVAYKKCHSRLETDVPTVTWIFCPKCAADTHFEWSTRVESYVDHPYLPADFEANPEEGESLQEWVEWEREDVSLNDVQWLQEPEESDGEGDGGVLGTPWQTAGVDGPPGQNL